ncbi:MAG: lipid carrier--UDP-N-acetylgalactosaminyltransferase [Micrococcales bacterium 70-64]|nr:sugar transferase [Leifsonia sp.]ODU66207.1 MAG: sugar transferase [Leifsonia sp. SCN 70-46]OJX87079.1 MAG: lipid carrier--UDP-N-acetylgalactosaminyltransferase [Micrococcales bacterium 70-64]
MYRFFKRFFDVLVSGVAVVILTPLLLPVVVALRLTGEGEVFYKQNRIGYKNTTFGIWKFATMLKDSPNLGTGSLTVRGDPRVTPVGRGLRATKINELPQLLNVLSGDMSFVGPRPQVQGDFDGYPPHVREHIYDVRPGVTGIGSIVFRDEERLLSRPGIDPRAFYRDEIAPYKGELEMWYLRRKSLLLDARLMLLTVWVVLRSESDLVYRTFPDLPARPSWFLD